MFHSPVDLSTANWRKSSKSTAEGNECVEVAHVVSHVGIRDSKNQQDTPLILPSDQWIALANQVKDGRYDLPHST